MQLVGVCWCWSHCWSTDAACSRAEATESPPADGTIGTKETWVARVDIIMPQMGESIAEGTLSKWLKKVGDEVKRDEPIFEISTDKVDAEIPAPAAGVLAEIIVKEGETVAVQTVVARLETEKGAVAGGGAREAGGGNAATGKPEAGSGRVADDQGSARPGVPAAASTPATAAPSTPARQPTSPTNAPSH